MKKHRLLLDMINNSIIFLSGYFTYPGMPSFLVLIMPMVNNKIILMATQKDILPNHILKKSLAKKINKFLKIPKELLKKKNGLINASKQKTHMAKSNYKMVVISNLDNIGKDSLPVLISKTIISTLGTKEINVVMIGVNTY